MILLKIKIIILGQSTATFNFNFSEVLLAAIVTPIFLYLWFKQFESNMIFINLRKDKKGKVSSETHSMPKGGWFKYLSSPHMTAEVGMYLILYALLFKNTSYIYCIGWVVSNQLSNALLTHKWYKETFSNYPKERKAFIPYVL